VDYFLQSDPAGTCCDCPARASPCDNCAGCPCPTLTFSGIQIDCPCINNGDGTSSQIFDSAVNNVTVPMGVLGSSCCSAPDCFNPCAFWQNVGTTHLNVSFKDWFSNTTCTGAPDFTGTERISPFIMLSGGKYYVLVSIGSGSPTGPLFTYFNGSATSLNSTITNLITVCGETSLTNPITACLSPFVGFLSEGHGGSVTIGTSASCGACTIGGVCNQMSSTACSQSAGTYSGDGTLCPP
jgi:hypothetical protein